MAMGWSNRHRVLFNPGSAPTQGMKTAGGADSELDDDHHHGSGKMLLGCNNEKQKSTTAEVNSSKGLVKRNDEAESDNRDDDDDNENWTPHPERASSQQQPRRSGGPAEFTDSDEEGSGLNQQNGRPLDVDIENVINNERNEPLSSPSSQQDHQLHPAHRHHHHARDLSHYSEELSDTDLQSALLKGNAWLSSHRKLEAPTYRVDFSDLNFVTLLVFMHFALVVLAPMWLWASAAAFFLRGIWCLPLCVLLGYYAYVALFDRDVELRDGKPWPAYTSGNWVCRMFRTYHALELLVPLNLKNLEFTRRSQTKKTTTKDQISRHIDNKNNGDNDDDDDGEEEVPFIAALPTGKRIKVSRALLSDIADRRRPSISKADHERHTTTTADDDDRRNGTTTTAETGTTDGTNQARDDDASTAAAIEDSTPIPTGATGMAGTSTSDPDTCGGVPAALRVGGYRPVKQGIFVMHPHGVLADFRLAMDGILGENLTSISSWRVLSARALFMLPCFREMALWTHCVDASLPVAESCIKRGHSLILCAGGEEEQLMTQRGHESICILRRKGFARLACKHALPIIPVYVFGSADLYHTSRLFMRLRMWIVKKLRVCIPIGIGKYGMLPAPGNLRVVFGSPVEPPAGCDASPAVVDELHGRFVDELKHLFDTWKVCLGYGERDLQIT